MDSLYNGTGAQYCWCHVNRRAGAAVCVVETRHASGFVQYIVYVLINHGEALTKEDTPERSINVARSIEGSA